MADDPERSKISPQPRFRTDCRAIISYPNPFGAWKWMVCWRPYRWEYAPRWLYRTAHSDPRHGLSRVWVVGLRFCCVSVHYEPSWRDCPDVRKQYQGNYWRD